MYEETEHAFGTDAVWRGVPLELVQKFLRHSDRRSTERYARLAHSRMLGVLMYARRHSRSRPDTVQRFCGLRAVGFVNRAVSLTVRSGARRVHPPQQGTRALDPDHARPGAAGTRGFATSAGIGMRVHSTATRSRAQRAARSCGPSLVPRWSLARLGPTTPSREAPKFRASSAMVWWSRAGSNGWSP